MHESEAWERVDDARHGVLGTIHPERGIDLVPVVHALTADRRVLIPVDRVKPKRTARLRRLENVELDPRCTLLVEHFDDDWAKLWWVRIHGLAQIVAGPDLEELRLSLAPKYHQYETGGSVVGGISLVPSGVIGWAAS